MQISFAVLNIEVADVNGAFYASSKDLPGLHIYGETKQQVCERVAQAIKTIFKHKSSIDVEVHQATTARDFPEVPQSCESSQFVVQRAA